MRVHARYLSIHRRHLALKSNEQVMIRNIQKLIVQVLNNLVNHGPLVRRKTLILGGKLFAVLMMYILCIITNIDEVDDELAEENKIDRKRTIDSFCNSDCWNFFETSKEDLYRLQVALRILDKVVFGNGSTMPGEEVMLRGLYEFVSGEDQYNITVNVFGRILK